MDATAPAAPAAKIADDSTIDSGDAGPTDPTRARLGQIVGGYVLLERLGVGGMGAVYAAYDPALHRRIAIKMVRQGGSRALALRLIREAQAMARITHPNVVVVHGAGEAGDEVYLAEELCDGGTLAAWLEVPRPLDAVLDHFRAAGRGLAAAHAAGIIHRDFKPSNVLFAKDGAIRVSDFGLARADGVDPVSGHGENRGALGVELTQHGSTLGTPAYMAPEQHGGGVVDARADQFAFCVALYEAAAGVAPFRGRDTEARVAEIEAGRLVAPARRVPAWLLRVVTRGLSARPDDRFPSMEALLDALVPPRRRAPMIAGAGLLAAIAIALVVWAPWRSRAPAACAGAAAGLDAAWSPARRAEVALRLDALGAGLAAPVAVALEARAEAWRAGRIDACRAHRVDHTQSADVFDRRMACLDRRLGELRGVTGVLAAASVDAAARAASVVERLPDAASCADVDRLLADVPPPPAAIAAQVADVRAGLDPHRALLDRAALDAAAAALPALRVEASRLAYPPLAAELALLAAEIAHRRRDFETAETEALVALAAAERGGDTQAARTARLRLTSVLAAAARGDAAITMAKVVGAELDGHGSPDERLGYEVMMGKLQVALGDLPASRAALERAITMARELGRPVAEADALDFRAYLGTIQGQPDAALADARAAVEVSEAALGAGHPTVAEHRLQLGDVLRTRGELAAARVELERAGAILGGAYGEEHQMVAYAAWTLGDLAAEAGDVPSATASYERALGIASRVMGPDHPDTAECEVRVAAMRREVGRLDDAAHLLDHAIEVHTAYSGKDGFLALRARAARATLRARAGEAAAALVEIDAVIAQVRAQQGDSDDTIGALLAGLEIAQLAGARARVRELAADVIAMAGRLGGHAEEIAIAKAAR